MAIKKSKIKSKPSLKLKKVKVKTKPVAKAKKTIKSKLVLKKAKPVAKVSKVVVSKPKADSIDNLPLQTMDVTRQMITQPNKRAAPPVVRRVSRSEPSTRNINQFTFMKAPAVEHAFEVGDNVEVFCDHEKSRERIRGWIKGIVVQVDNKMVAVQFRSNVFLTDGWMVPDRILWYPLTSEHIRPMPGKKAVVKKELIPDY